MHTLPRFSVDCDIVIKDKKELKKIKEVLKKIGYQKIEESKKSTPYHGTFVRYEKEIEKGFKVSMDIFIEKVLDRQTGAVLDAKWIFENAIDQDLKGKTFQEKLQEKQQTWKTDLATLVQGELLPFEQVKKEIMKKIN